MIKLFKICATSLALAAAFSIPEARTADDRGTVDRGRTIIEANCADAMRLANMT